MDLYKRDVIKQSLIESNIPIVGEDLLNYIITKFETESLVSQVANIQYLNSPIAKLPSFITLYSGKKDIYENQIDYINSRILFLNNITLDLSTNNNYILSNNAEIKILYIYASKKAILVKIINGNIEENTTFNINPSIKILSISANRTLINTFLPIVEENFEDSNFLNLSLKTFKLETSTKILKSSLSIEDIQDILNLYKENAYKILGDILYKEIVKYIDYSFIKYVKSIAKPVTDINVSPTQNYEDISFTLQHKIHLMIKDIVQKTNIDRKCYILTDPTTFSILATNNIDGETIFNAVSDEHNNIFNTNNIYLAGYLNKIYPVYVDPFSDKNDNYILVGYLGNPENKYDINSSIIYGLYNIALLVNDYSVLGKSLIALAVRSVLKRTPLDENEEGLANSSLFNICQITYDIPNNIPFGL